MNAKRIRIVTVHELSRNLVNEFGRRLEAIGDERRKQDAMQFVAFRAGFVAGRINCGTDPVLYPGKLETAIERSYLDWKEFRKGIGICKKVDGEVAAKGTNERETDEK